MKQPISLERNAPRADWRQRVEDAGLIWHGAGAEPYWVENQHLALNLKAAETLERAANELHQMCLHACGEIVKNGWWDRLAIPENAIGQVMNSWMESDFSLYGRFDLAWNGRDQPKLLEYNADTPTSLLEAAVIQWHWLEDNAPGDDQLNSLHEMLVDRWAGVPESMVHFACAWESLEDRQTIAYLAETAEQAGKTVELMDMSEVGFSQDGFFTDSSERRIEKLFKLYPWEWMAGEPFFRVLGMQRSRFIEPAWKMMLSNKGLLPVLWELFPGHPLLLPAATSRVGIQRLGASEWVEKPFFGREGSGVSIVRQGAPFVDHPTDPLAGPLVYQTRTNLYQAEGYHFVWGLWMVGDECCCLSARGDASPVTGNLSRFFPHRII